MNEVLEEYVRERTEDVRKESLMAGMEVGKEAGRKETILLAAEKIAARFSISLEEAREILTT